MSSFKKPVASFVESFSTTLLIPNRHSVHIFLLTLSSWTFPAVIREISFCLVRFVSIIPGPRLYGKYICRTLPGCHSVNIFVLNSSSTFKPHIWFVNNLVTFLACFSKFLGRHSENICAPFR